jgi:WhiB family redox-sensing transcriptional regulator
MTAPAPAAPDVEQRPARRESHAASHEWEWQLRGACRQADPELFFHPWGERDPSRSRREVAAKKVCADCPVVAHCRDYALESREPYGVWGGLSEHDREAILGVRFG